MSLLEDAKVPEGSLALDRCLRHRDAEAAEGAAELQLGMPCGEAFLSALEPKGLLTVLVAYVCAPDAMHRSDQN